MILWFVVLSVTFSVGSRYGIEGVTPTPLSQPNALKLQKNLYSRNIMDLVLFECSNRCSIFSVVFGGCFFFFCRISFGHGVVCLLCLWFWVPPSVTFTGYGVQCTNPCPFSFFIFKTCSCLSSNRWFVFHLIGQHTFNIISFLQLRPPFLKK